jgi:parvulin-like peptidyl-prolyl isomerase
MHSDKLICGARRAGLTCVRVGSYLFLLVAVTIGLVAAQDTPTQETKAAVATPATETQTSASPDRVIIKVGDAQVTEAEFESGIRQFEPKADPDNASAKDRRRLGDDYASVLMLSQQAIAEQLDSTPEVRQQLAEDRLQILSDAEFARLLSQSKASPEEMSQYYNAHLSEFDRVKIRRLFIWKVGQGSRNTHGLQPEEAKARAAAILQEAASGGDPEKLAGMLRDSDKGLFDAQPVAFVRGQLPANLDKAAFTMKVGQWTQGEDTPDRMILLYLVARDREALSEVDTMIEKLVQGEKMQTKLDEMKKKAGVWMDEKYFGSGSTVAKDPGEQRPVSKPLSETRN